MFLSKDQRLAISPNRADRLSVLAKGGQAKAYIMAKAMESGTLLKDPGENSQGIEWLAKDFTAELGEPSRKYSFHIKASNIVARHMGKAVGEIDFTIEKDRYLGKYLYCCYPIRGSEMQMRFWKEGDYYYGNDAWVDCGFLVDESHQGKGIGTLLMASAMMHAYLNLNARFARFGLCEPQTIKIGTDLGCELFGDDTLAGNIDPAAIKRGISGRKLMIGQPE